LVQESAQLNASRDISGIAVEGWKRELRLRVWDPAGLELDTFKSLQPQIVNWQVAWIPIAFHSIGTIREKYQARLENPGE
jgi:hypothetical protein